KSTLRYSFLAPPPRKLTAMRPPPPRPPVLVRPSIRLFSGLPLWSSCLSTSTRPRRPGEVGLNCLSAMTLEPRRDVDGLAFGQGDDGLLHVRALTHPAAEALGLALHVDRVDLDHVHLEQVLDRLGDLRLGGVRGDAEHDLVVLRQHRRLLGDHRRQNGVVMARGGHQAASFPLASWANRAAMPSMAALVSTSVSRRRMS